MITFNCADLICPLCGMPLCQDGGSLICPQHHTFDIARQGYVNLLPVQQKHSLSPGDTPDMLAARRNFLNAGHYLPICGDVIRALEGIPGGLSGMIDVGCGEGYYTSRFHEKFPEARMIGADISKAAVKMAASRTKDIRWITATASRLPVADGSTDAITAMFSLLCEEEFARLLRPGGRVIEVTAGTQHLIELKRIIYDDLFEQHKRPKVPQGYLHEIACELKKFRLTLHGEDLKNLLLMTPHTLRIKPENRARLSSVPSLDLTVEYYVRVLGKR
ncbi:MAG: methyltransferase domain-containing protein [Clostridia bacterium]|nr:methyltransferase domain-containing protein [Clostridia bacterium]